MSAERTAPEFIICLRFADGKNHDGIGYGCPAFAMRIPGFPKHSSYLKIISGRKKKYKMYFVLSGILLTMVDKNGKLAGRIEVSAQRDLGKGASETSIPENRKLKNALYYERPLIAKDVKAAASRSSVNLAREIMDKS